MKYLILAIALALTSCSGGAQFECQFDRIPGIYTTDRFRLLARGELILVKKDGREFAFPREQIISCQQAGQ